MDLHKIKGPKDYHTFYHTSSEGLVWLGRMGNPISYHMLGAHVEVIDLTDLWNSVQGPQTKCTSPWPWPHQQYYHRLHTPLMTTPTSPIMEHHVKVSQPEGSSMVMVKELLEYPHIQPRMMQSALSAVTSLFTPNISTQLPE